MAWDIILSDAIMFTFRLMHIGKVWTPLFLDLCVKYTPIVLLQVWLGHYITREGLYAIKTKKTNQTLTGTIIPGQSERVNNADEDVTLQPSHISRSGASQSDVV